MSMGSHCLVFDYMKIENQFWHIMFLPVLGEVEESLLLNLATVVVFIGIYLWHLRHDHAHRDEQAKRDEELLREVKEIKEEMKRTKKV